MNIYFLLPSNSISGGIFTVFNHASALSRKGHSVTIGFILKDDIEEKKNQPEMDDVRFKAAEDLIDNEPFDIVVATWWETMFLLPNIPARHYIYFIQGFEDEFYNKESLPTSLITRTYKENVHFATVSDALANRLSKQFQKKASVVPCGINLPLFQNAEPAIPRRGKIRALVEGLPNDERKQVAFTLNVLSSFEELEVIYVSPYGRPEYEAKIDYFFQSVPHDQMPSLYKSCDFIVKLSTTESFALPVLEMFACGGTAVVSAFKGHEEYIRNDENALVVPAEDREAAHNAVHKLIKNNDMRTRLQESARTTAQRYSLSNSTECFEKVLTGINGDCSDCGKLEHIKSAHADYEKFDKALIKF